jgi:protein TonB
VTSVPVATEGADTKEKSAAAPLAVSKDAAAEGGPETPPSFRAAYLRNPEPPYPAASRRLGEQGTVQLRVLVSADGHAARVDVHRTSGFPRLDDAASAAVREWRFVAAKRGATPVEALVIVPIVFRLEGE